ncbi:MAG: hypothetical protein Q8N99_02575 [Nanoarchaeota archaeon]|nr:hypothetical protein [Nanoarchaeota archaeon]
MVINDTKAGTMSFRMMLLLIAIIMTVLGVLIPELYVMMYFGIIMFVVWILGNFFNIILNLDK